MTELLMALKLDFESVLPKVQTSAVIFDMLGSKTGAKKAEKQVACLAERLVKIWRW